MTRFAAVAPSYSIPKIVAALRKREAMHKTSTFGLLVGGALWLFVAAGCIGTLGFMMQVTRRGRGITPPGTWWQYFWMTSVVSVPLLFLLDRATRGKLIEDAA